MKEKKENKKRSGSVTLGLNRRRRSHSVMEKCSKQPLCPPSNQRERPTWGNHKGGSRKSRHRRFFSPFSTPIPAFFRACGLVMGTGDEDCPEALLAGMDTTLADLVISAAAVLPEEEGPLQPPLLAPAHRSCSGGLLLLGPVRGLALAALPFGLRQPFPDGGLLLRRGPARLTLGLL